jgi:hypothetical protein
LDLREANGDKLNKEKKKSNDAEKQVLKFNQLYKIIEEEQIKRLHEWNQIIARQTRILFESPAVQWAEAMAEAQRPMVEYIKKYNEMIIQAKEVWKRALTEGITNFDSPENYNTDRFQVKNWLYSKAKTDGQEILKEFESTPLSYFYERYENGFLSYEDEFWQSAIFTFLSMTDGLMTYLCERNHDISPGGWHGLRYTISQKRAELMRVYGATEEFIDETVFRENLEKFWQHRHEIMHGGQNAHFDKNIATISLLFLVFTYYIVKSEIFEGLEEE